MKTKPALPQKAVDLIKAYEGIHDGNLKQIGLQPKLCPAGIWTVGYGHALTDPVTHKFLRGSADAAKALALYPSMTMEQAEALLAADLRKFDAIVASYIKPNLSAEQFGALVSFTFNLGAGSLAESTLLKKVNGLDFAGAALEFAKWNKATIDGVKKELTGLTLRRMSEKHLFETGELKIFSK